MEHVLIVEDADSLREVLTSVLEGAGFLTYSATCAEEALEIVKTEHFSCILSDYKLPQKTGIDLLKATREICPATPFIVMTAFGTIDMAVEAMRNGANDYITKPFNPEYLCTTIKDVIEHKRIIDRSGSYNSQKSRRFLTQEIKTERRSSPETQLTEFSLSQLRKEFVNLFSGQGFTVQKAVDVSSGGDSTVLFIGSNISALKGIVLGDVPPEGVVIDQPSMRFRELKKLFDPKYRSNYGSFFNELGAFTRHSESKRLVGLLNEYLRSTLGINESDLIIRVSSKDEDLLRIAADHFANLEVDSMPDKYYRHTIGEKGFVGRNFNIAVRNKKTGSFDDVGNFLAFTKDGELAFLEVALGDTVILRSMKGLEHVLDCYDVVTPEGLSRIEKLNFTNVVIVSTVLYREGLVASNISNQARILSKHLRYLFMLKNHKRIADEDIKTAVISFEMNYYGKESKVFERISSDISRKEVHFRKTLESQFLTPIEWAEKQPAKALPKQ